MRKILRVLEWLIQSLSAAIVYYSCEALFDYFAFRERFDLPLPRFVSILLVACFTFLAISAFVVLTLAWHRILSHKPGTRFPEVPMIFGTLVLMPVYFQLASHLIYNPRAIQLSELIDDLYWSYLWFPLTVVEIGSYTLSLHVFPLAAVAAVLTGYLLRKRGSRFRRSSEGPGLTFLTLGS